MEIRNISKSYAGKNILKDVSFLFPDRSVTAITGPSGRGKTTLLRILLGLTTADSGEIIAPLPMRKACVFQEDRLIEHMNAVDNVALTAVRGVSAKTIKRAIEELGLDPENKEPVSKYSGGMRRRVAIVRAVMAEPDFLALDEPFKGLDESIRAAAARYILKNRSNACIVLVTHDPEELRLMNAAKVLELK